MPMHLSVLLLFTFFAIWPELGSSLPHEVGMVKSDNTGMTPIIIRKFGEQITLNVALLVITVSCFYGLGCWMGTLSANCGGASVRPEEPRSFKTKATQSPTTYTWKATTPWFTPVHSYGHGAWDV